MADTKISAATDAGTLLATDMLPLARSGSTSAYHATMTEIGAFTNATLPVASTTVPGVVKVDGSTITIASGVISGVSPAPYGSLPAMDGTANAGAVSAWSRGDHVHPIDTSRAPLASPALIGAPTAPTPTTGDNSTKLATTAFVQAQMVASGAGVSTWNTRAGAVVLQQSDLVAQGNFHDTGRNLVMNGAFAVQQRGAGPFSASGYTLDRWSLEIPGDTVSISRQALLDTDRAAIGDEAAAFCFQDVFTGSAAATAFHSIYQCIEQVRRVAGKTVTVSFWAKGSAALKLGINGSSSYGTGGSPSGGDNALVTGIAIPITTVWARYSTTLAIPSASGRTLGTNGDDYFRIRIAFSSGANANSFWGNIGVQSGTIQLYGVQLEIGTQATPFDAGGTPQQQLAQCQRFYQSGYFQLTAYQAAGFGFNGTEALPVQMRAAPTVAFQGTSLVNLPSIALQAGPFSGFIVIGGVATASGATSIVTYYTASADL